MKTYKILITNDDGIESPGLKAAVEAVTDLGEIVVAAPRTQQTSMGRSLNGIRGTKLEPIHYYANGEKIEAYTCECSPASITRHTIFVRYQNILPDLIISGINYGENIGSTITCSGTVGAALEAANFGIQSIAISKETDIASHRKYTEQNWEPTKYFLNYFAKQLLKNKLPEDVDLLKIDVPDNANTETPWEIAKVSRIRHYHSIFDNPTIGTGLGEETLIINKEHEFLEKNSDINVFLNKRTVAVVPISLDLTSRTDFNKLRKIIEK